MGVRFQYARKLRECNECGEKIQLGDLLVNHQWIIRNWYHFDCFFKQRAVDEFRKSDIMILLKPRFNNKKRTIVSLESYDKHPDRFQLDITITDLTNIREQFALAKEHKTFIPRASKTANLNCHGCSRSSSVVGGEIGLYFQGNNYHPECLLKTGKVNVDAKEIRDYDSLSEDDKKLLDELFKKDDAAFLPPRCVPFDGEHCSFLKCRKNYRKNGLRIRYQTKTYHPKCFAEMGKVNMDDEEIGNYNSLCDEDKQLLRELFEKSNVFDVPLIEKAKRDDYCTLADCRAANSQPSKFPYPYTIKCGQIQIKFHGDIYHLKCFKASEIVNMDIKNFLGYESLSPRTKQLLEETSEDIEMDIEEGEPSGNGDGSDSSDFESDQMDGDDVNEGPPANMSNMEPQMQDENVSNENIHNDFDNDQEHFDGTNVREEMSEPNVLQMNTLNELYNAGVGAQIINRSEEREGNHVVENVVSGNEQEIVTLDDEAGTNEVQPEIRQESVAELYIFGVPSGEFLRSTLEQFDIEPTNEVYGFYREFQYTRIPTTASPGATFEISSSTDSFFKCLSLYFTGKEKHFSYIKMGIQAYFYHNSKTFGTIDGTDFSNLKKSSPEFQKLYECNELTNAYFTFICSWFNCRIGIFSNGRLSRKYGSWNEKHPIFLIGNENGFYKPVLSLN